MIEAGRVIIAGRREAGEILCSEKRRAPFAYLISIGGSDDRPPAGFRYVAERLRLRFEDAVTDAEAGPTKADVEALIRFCRTVDLRKGAALVQCEVGISRSAAAALILAAVILGAGSERQAAAYIKTASPGARPNRRMLELAGEVLSSGRALVEAWEAIQREPD